MRVSEKTFPCNGCGAVLEFAPGTESLKCPYCGQQQAIPKPAVSVEAEDLETALSRAADAELTVESLTVKCASCGAESTLPAGVTADRCAFCGTTISAARSSTRTLRPKALLPFKVGRNDALTRFRNWVNGLWFAPDALKQDSVSGSIQGMYLPFWTYHCEASTRYAGQRGEDYQDTESYTEYENGRPVTRTREVTRTRWHPCSGWVRDSFDDVTVPATTSLPENKLLALEPWDFENLVGYEESYLSGFRVESYQVDLRTGFEKAKALMAPTIHASICRDIGGDHQRVDNTYTSYSQVTFKHVLLPLWISSYRFGDKTYRFMVNARTGEVQGDRPWSWIKITLAILAALFLLSMLLCGGALVTALLHGGKG